MKIRSAFEKIGGFPRSINQMLRKLSRSLLPSTEAQVVAEFQMSCVQTITAIRFILLLILIPLLVNQLSRTIVFQPPVEQI